MSPPFNAEGSLGKEDIKQAYSEFVGRKILFLVASLAVLFLLVVFSASIGGTTKSEIEVFNAIASRFLPFINSDPFVEGIIWHLRLPRILLGIVAGAGLAVSGTAMQGVTRNPLVSPFTVGISSAAAFGASMAIMFGLGYTGAGTYLIILSAFVSALGCAFLVFFLTRLKRSSPETLVLAGIALTYFFGSLTAILQFFASEQQLNAMVNWTFGTLSGADWDKMAIVTASLLLTLPILIRLSWDLNVIFSGGDETAKSLGINVSRVRTLSLLLSSSSILHRRLHSCGRGRHRGKDDHGPDNPPHRDSHLLCRSSHVPLPDDDPRYRILGIA